MTKAKGFGEDALVIYELPAKTWAKGPPAPLFRFPSLRLRVLGSGERRWEPSSRSGAHEPHVEAPVAALDLLGRIFWFSKAGPIFYDIARSTWEQPPGPLWQGADGVGFVSGAVPHVERINAAAATAPDGKIYLLGGAGHALLEQDRDKRLVLLSSLEVYDAVANTYTMKAPMRQGRQIFAAEFGPDGKLYAFGGYGTVPSVRSRDGETQEQFDRRRAERDRLSRSALDSVEAYDPATNTWSDRRRMPKPVMSGDAVRCPDGRIYLVGGERAPDGETTFPDTWIYDAWKDAWTKGPSLRTARHGHGLACTADGKLYAIGGTNHFTVPTLGSLLGGEGRDEGGPLASVEVLDTTKLANDR